jgi:membrane associated rhomboid family serine protease
MVQTGGGFQEAVHGEVAAWKEWFWSTIAVDDARRYPLVVLPIFCTLLYLIYLVDFAVSRILCAGWSKRADICLDVLSSNPLGGLEPGQFLEQPRVYWMTLFTYALHHFNGFHLWSNLACGFPAMVYLEHRFGWARTAAVITLSTFFGGLCIAAFFPRTILAAGASVFVYALLFAIVWDRIVNREARPRVLLTVMLVLALIVTTLVEILAHDEPWVLLAHLYGGLTGFAMATVLYPNFRWDNWEYFVLIPLSALYLLFSVLFLPLYIAFAR